MHFKLVYFHCSKKSCKLPPDPWIISLVYKVISILQIRHNQYRSGESKKKRSLGFWTLLWTQPRVLKLVYLVPCSSLLPELVSRHKATNRRSSIEYTFAILGECRFEEVFSLCVYPCFIIPLNLGILLSVPVKFIQWLPT